MDSDLILLAVSDVRDADRYAEALIQTGAFAFIFARDAVSALTYAESTRPGAVIIALEDGAGPALARAMRDAQPDDLRVVLVIDQREFRSAREASANALILRPAAAVMVAVETVAALRREERRATAAGDRRQEFRGGRRLTDINLG